MQPKTLDLFDVKLGDPPSTYRVVALGRRYANGRKAIQLLGADPSSNFHGEVVAVATVNIEGAPLDQRGEVLIKDWNENEGMLESLVAAGLIFWPHSVARTGRVLADRCKLTEKGLDLFDD